MNHSSDQNNTINNELPNTRYLVHHTYTESQPEEESNVKLLKLVEVNREHHNWSGEQNNLELSESHQLLPPASTTTQPSTSKQQIKYIHTTLPIRHLIKSSTTITSTPIKTEHTQPFIIKKSSVPVFTVASNKKQISPEISTYSVRNSLDVPDTELYQPVIERPLILGNSSRITAKNSSISTVSTQSSTSSRINVPASKSIRPLTNRPVTTNAKLPTINTTKRPFSVRQPPQSVVIFDQKLPVASNIQTPTTVTSRVIVQQPHTKKDSFKVPSKNDIPVTFIETETRPTERIVLKSSPQTASLSPALTKQSISTEIRYRNILESLLQLKNSFVQRSVTQAIQQKICNQTSADLLNVIFKTFELILTSIDIQQISVNEAYLTATAAFLTKVIDTGKFRELIQNRKEVKDIYQYITATMSTILNRVTLETAYKSARDIFSQKNRNQYAQILELLAKSVGCLRVVIDNRLSPREISFWLKDVLPLIFDLDTDIQTNAIKAMDKVIPLLLISNHQENPHWPTLQSDILKHYTARITFLFAKGSQKWHTVWCQCVRLLDVEIPRSATVLNAFLQIVEVALRSTTPQRRAEGYICWRVLLEVLVRHNRLNSEKRLKLMCTPLKSLQARTSEIAMNKFQAWWYVICNIRDDTRNYIDMVFEPFLQFCFGPLSKAPNLLQDSIETPTQVKSYPMVSLMAINSLACLLGSTDPIIKKKFKTHGISGPKHQILTANVFDQNETAGMTVINACGEATVMLNTHLQTSNDHERDEYVHLLNLIWSALFNHINRAQNIQYIQLVFSNLFQLHKLRAASNAEKPELILLACNLIMSELSTSFIIDASKSDLVIKSLLRLFNMLVLDPSIKKFTASLQSKLLALLINSTENFTQFIIEAYDGFFDRSPTADEGIDLSTFGSSKFQIWSELADSIATFLRQNTNVLKELHANSIPVFDVFFKFLYWPLMLSLSDTETQFDSYLEKMLKTIDLMLTIVDKRFFYKESAKTLELIIKTPLHCNNINNAIAILFDDMDYEFNDILDAPIEMLDLCSQLLQKNPRILFQDCDSIAKALIDYRRRLVGTTAFEIIAPKLHDVMAQLLDSAHTMRTDNKLIEEIRQLLILSNGSDMEKSKSTIKKMDKDGFLIVDKVWELEPTKLTDHQREKMKTRRSDIPAMYNDLSRSQDSTSIHKWAPNKRDIAIADTQKENVSAEEAKEEIISNTEIKKSSPRTDENTDADDSSQSKKVRSSIKSSVSSNNNDKSMDEKKECEKKDESKLIKTDNKKKTPSKQQSSPQAKPDEKHGTKTKRVTREQSRMECELNRSSRRSISKMATSVDTQTEKRKTRSEKTSEPSFTQHVDLTSTTTRRTTRASLSAPTTPAQKQKTRPEASKRSASQDNNQSLSQPGSKRARQTRQSKNHASSAIEVDENSATLKEDEIKKEVLSDDESKLIKGATQNGVDPDTVALKPSDGYKTNMDESIVTKEEEKEPEVVTKSDQIEIAPELEITNADKPLMAENTPEEKQSENSTDGHVVIGTEKIMPTESVTLPDTLICNGDRENLGDGIQEDKADVPDTLIDQETDRKKEEADENKILSDLSKSYMSTLVFDPNDLSPEKLSKSNENSIVTSPTSMDVKRNLEFLNDTLNISPIALNSQSKDTSVCHTSEDVMNEEAKKALTAVTKPIIPDSLTTAENSENTKNTPKEKRRKSSTFPMPMRVEDIKVEPEDRLSDTELEMSKNDQLNNGDQGIPTTPSQTTQISRIVSSTGTLKSSTPVQSHHSPVSSKFRTQLLGRGAQLLQMLNTNRNTRGLSSPVPSTSAGPSSSDFISGISSPIPSRLQHQIQKNDEFHTPEQEFPNDDHNGLDDDRDYLTFSSVLPSPYDSPGAGILKRRLQDDGDDTSRCSPAAKRKRVSFNFPLSSTKEYIIEDENPQLYPLFNDSPSSQRNGIKASSSRSKFRWKRIKHKSNSAKALAKFAANDASSSSSSTSTATTKPSLNESVISLDLISEHLHNDNENDAMVNENDINDQPEEQVSVSHIRERIFPLEIDTIPPTTCPNAHDGSDANHAARPIEAISEGNAEDMNCDNLDLDPDVESSESAESAATAVDAIGGDLNSFSDDDIFRHLTKKYSMNDILERLEPSINIECAHFMISKILSMIETSKRTEQLVMEQLAEKHPKSFLEYAIGENSTKEICDRVVENSEQEFIDYFVKKAQEQESFSQAMVKLCTTPDFRVKFLMAMNLDEQRQLVDEIIAKVPKDDGTIEAATYTWVANLLRRFKFTPEQFLSLTSLYLQQNPVQGSF